MIKVEITRDEKRDERIVGLVAEDSPGQGRGIYYSDLQKSGIGI